MVKDENSSRKHRCFIDGSHYIFDTHCPYLMGQLFLIIQKQISDVTLKIQILMFLQDMTKYIQ